MGGGGGDVQSSVTESPKKNEKRQKNSQTSFFWDELKKGTEEKYKNRSPVDRKCIVSESIA